jgi:hypothetical protein
MDVKFNYGVYVNVGSYDFLADDTEFTVLIKEKIGDRILFKTAAENLYRDYWFLSHEQFFANNIIELWAFVPDQGMTKVNEYTYNPEEKLVRIDLHYENRLEGQSWVKISKEFQKKWKCYLVLGVPQIDLDRFRRIFPNKNFIGIEEEFNGTYASYRIGRFDMSEDRTEEITSKSQYPGWNLWHWWRYSRSFQNPSDWRMLHSEDIAREILGLGTNRKFKYDTIDSNFFVNYQASNILNEKIE